MDLNTTGEVAAGLGATATFLSFLGVKKFLPWLRRVGHFLDDLMGEPARPGREARPGLMERVAQVELRVDEVHHEVTNNDGSSLKDAVHRVERNQAAQQETLSHHLEESDELKRLGREEATRMWAAVEAVANSTPPHKPTTIRR